MGSSEIGRVTGQKSQFSHTCNLLSQYMKKNGSVGDLSNLGIYRNTTGTQTATTTMNLLPMIEKSGDSGDSNPPKPMNLFPQGVVFSKEQTHSKPIAPKSEAEKSQMTIFYGGQVIVFDDFPAEKASEIMKLASKGKQADNNSYYIPKSAESCNFVTSCWTKDLPISDLPIARRNSLSRFLEKRKDRLAATAPYQISKKEENNYKDSAWLGLGAHVAPLKTEHFF